ncbi:MAG TPA: hypothetical protein ENG29_00050 [Firmicutes bacterium]|nr:MAG: hypothetical protein DRH51_04075 [Candidatus Coatesbacteria bacterium]RLC41497.1 MAG: hypothetical protein DRH49_05340 [Candidatus Coatesbacteria bacterium]HDM42760.1 hypothetical protein [Bacillota bacterium]
MRYLLPVVLLLLTLSLSLHGQEMELEGIRDVVVIPFHSNEGDEYISDVVTAYLRNALIFMDDALTDTPYVLKAMDWRGLKKGDKVSLEDAVEIGKKLNATTIYFGDIKKSGKSYTIHLTKAIPETGEIIFSKEKVADDLYLISRKIDEILGLSPDS